MRKVKETVLVEAPPSDVWEVLMDPYFIPKLYPDLLNITVDPHGRAVVGQKRTAAGRAGKRLIEFRTEVAALDPLKRFELVGRDGAAFESLSEVIELEAVKGGTQLTATYVFKISETYFGPQFDVLTLEQMAVRNQEVFIKNLKEISELRSFG